MRYPTFGLITIDDHWIIVMGTMNFFRKSIIKYFLEILRNIICNPWTKCRPELQSINTSKYSISFISINIGIHRERNIYNNKFKE